MLEDWLEAPLSARGGSLTNPTASPRLSGQLARVNFLRSEPGSAALASGRVFLNDNNRNLYIVERTGTFHTYINFQAVFPKFDNDPGFAGGVVTFAFDPEYASNGTFYTVHTEDPLISGDGVPVNANLPGLDVTAYSTTRTIDPPAGAVTRHAVLVQWTDTDIANTTFEGQARELLRLGFNNVIHPMGDLVFNPNAAAGSPDYRNLYIASGDGGAGEQATEDDGVPGLTPGDRHFFPQRLDTLLGKILRIMPDLNLRPTDILAENGRYRVPSGTPDANPFVELSGSRKEIYAYGFRNPHRLSWDPVSDLLISTDIGRFTFEEVNII